MILHTNKWCTLISDQNLQISVSSCLTWGRFQLPVSCECGGMTRNMNICFVPSEKFSMMRVKPFLAMSKIFRSGHIKIISSIFRLIKMLLTILKFGVCSILNYLWCSLKGHMVLHIGFGQCKHSFRHVLSPKFRYADFTTYSWRSMPVHDWNSLRKLNFVNEMEISFATHIW